MLVELFVNYFELLKLYFLMSKYFTDTDCLIWETPHNKNENGYCVLGYVISHICIAINTIFWWKFNYISC